jgi:hypothetical protein
MRIRLASLLVAGSLLALALAAPAQAKSRYLRFEVLSVKGQQTANWTGTRDSGGCGTIHRSGSQTISFESLRPSRLRLRGFPRTNPRTGKRRRGFDYFGWGIVPANWTFTRTFQQSTPPSCPPSEEPIVAQAQANDCGTKGPYATPVTVGWRGGFVEFRGVMDPEKPRPTYRSCEYEAFHAYELIDSKGRLSQRRLTSRRRQPIRVKVSARLKEPAVEGEGSQTTVLEATVTLRRRR